MKWGKTTWTYRRALCCTVCLRSLDSFYIANHTMKIDKSNSIFVSGPDAFFKNFFPEALNEKRA